MLRSFFIRFRRSNAFLYTLLAALAIWVAMHEFAHFDPDMSVANLVLSFEASVATCMLLDLQFRMSAEDRATLQRIIDLEQSSACRHPPTDA